MEFSLQAALTRGRLKPELRTKSPCIHLCGYGVQPSGCTDSGQAKACIPNKSSSPAAGRGQQDAVEEQPVRAIEERPERHIVCEADDMPVPGRLVPKEAGVLQCFA